MFAIVRTYGIWTMKKFKTIYFIYDADAKITMGIYAHYIPETAVDIHQYMPDIDISNGSNS